MTAESCSLPRYNHVADLVDGGLAHIRVVEAPSHDIFVLKLYPKSTRTTFSSALANYRSEVAALSRIRHPSVITLYQHSEDYDYCNVYGVVYPSHALVLEHCPNGDLHDFISRTGRFSEPLARAYFRDLLDAVRFCHLAGVLHRDLKPENLLLGHDFQLKLADFGSALIPGVPSSEVFGTPVYLPPEVHEAVKTHSLVSATESIDIYSCGVILYFLLTRGLPFRKPCRTDSLYYLFLENKSAFWASKCYLSPLCKHLIESMLAPDPQARPTMSQVLCHPWLADSIPSPDAIRAEMQERSMKKR